MPVKKILDEIKKEVEDVTKTSFEHIDTSVVPGINDVGLTYEKGIAKKGKKIETCVLFVDIRNSIALTEKHHTQTMGRIYTAFTKAVLKLARHHLGHTRNIIGDRVMIVFPSKNCFTNAVQCAISIHYVAEKIINKLFNLEFKCGIGIDYGELRVIKVGIQRNGTENAENKGLVWVGYPANLASRLTDFANKEVENEYYEVTRNPINPRAMKPLFPFPTLMGNLSDFDTKVPYYLTKTEKVNLTPSEFADSLRQLDGGEIFTLGGKMLKFEKKKNKNKFPPILISESVYKGYKSENSEKIDMRENWWKEQPDKIPNMKGKVYGSYLTWKI
jgi:class 3 adenylate cyclase